MIKQLSLYTWMILMLVACSDEENFTPRPKGYFRISLPDKKYQVYQGACPYSFEYPTYAQLLQDENQIQHPCFQNLTFGKLNSTLHLSYKAIDATNLATLTEDSRNLAAKHQIKATGIQEFIIMRDSAKVYGTVYNISGNAASSLQFYITDSTHHFLRGALYFNNAPNYDSIQPVLRFIQKDVEHFIQTFRWK